jgi:hypothetical protein
MFKDVMGEINGMEEKMGNIGRKLETLRIRKIY